MIPGCVCEDFAGGFPCFTSAGPGLCPFVLDVVEVRTVWGQVFKSVPCGFDQGSCVTSPVEGGAVHHRYGFGGQPGDQVMFKPEVEDVGINIGFGQPHAQQNPPRTTKPR